jgi:hypothetical protein
MRPFLWLMAATLPLGAQPKLLVNAKLDTRSAAAGLEQTFRPLVTAQPQPAWIAYSVPSTRVNLGCDYVRDGWSQPGVIHLEPPDHAVILFRVDGGAVERIRTLSPDCEIDAGDLPVHWLADVKPAESVALLDTFATQREPVDPLRGLHEVRGLGVVDILELLRVAVHQREPGALHLHHDPVARRKQWLISGIAHSTFSILPGTNGSGLE